MLVTRAAQMWPKYAYANEEYYSVSLMCVCVCCTICKLINYCSTLKSHIRECSQRHTKHDATSGNDDAIEELVKEGAAPAALPAASASASSPLIVAASTSKTPIVTEQPRVSATKTHIPSRRMRRLACPLARIERSEQCAMLLNNRKMREIFRLPSDYVLANFEVQATKR